MKTKFKIKCEFVTDLGEKQTVGLVAVESDESKSLWAAFPNGRLDLGGINKSINFKPGKEYSIEISE